MSQDFRGNASTGLKDEHEIGSLECTLQEIVEVDIVLTDSSCHCCIRVS